MPTTATFTLLGTGTSQGVPVIGCSCQVCTSTDPRDQRLRTSALLRTEHGTIVIDCGPDFRQQMLRSQVNRLDAILITHEHNDHVIGLDDVRPFNFRQSVDMPVYCSSVVAQELRHRFAYVFAAIKYPGAPSLILPEMSANVPLQLIGETITPILASHGRIPVFGFRIRDLVYLTDVKTIPEASKFTIRGAKHLIINALHHHEHHSHLNLKEALELADELRVPNVYLTHISHQMGRYMDVNPELPKGVQLGYDGLEIKF